MSDGHLMAQLEDYDYGRLYQQEDTLPLMDYTQLNGAPAGTHGGRHMYYNLIADQFYHDEYELFL